MFNQVLRPVVRSAAVQSGKRSYFPLKNWKTPTLDDAPVPQGSWKESYDRTQKKYNMQLAGGILCLAGTLAYTYISGAIYLNIVPITLPENQDD